MDFHYFSLKNSSFIYLSLFTIVVFDNNCQDSVYLNDKAVVMCGSFCSKYKLEKSIDGGNNWSTLTETGSVITVTLDVLKYVRYKCTLDRSCGIGRRARQYKIIHVSIPLGNSLYAIHIAF